MEPIAAEATGSEAELLSAAPRPQRRLVLWALGAVAGCALLASATLLPRRSARLRASAVLDREESPAMRSPEGFSCRRQYCQDVAEGYWGAGECKSSWCRRYEVYEDGRVEEHAEACAEACRRDLQCGSSVVQMQGKKAWAPWNGSACFFLRGRCAESFPNDVGYYWGATCERQVRPPSATAALEGVWAEGAGAWLPLFSLSMAHSYRLGRGVKGEANVSALAYSGPGVLLPLFERAKQTEETFEVRFHHREAESYLWQWAFLAPGNVTLRTEELALTSGKWQPPRCLPGRALDAPRYQRCFGNADPDHLINLV